MAGDSTTLIILLGISFIMHLVYLTQLQESPYGSLLMVDANSYHLKALKILQDGWLGSSVFYQAPFYPYFLAISYKLFGQDTSVPQWIQVALSVTNVWLAYRITTLLFDSQTGIIAATLLTFTGVTLHFSGLLLKVTLSLFCSFILIYTLLRASMEKGFGKWLAGGILLGVNITLRGNFLLMIPGFVIWIFLCLNNKPFQARFRRALIFFIGTALVIFPITLRNYYISGEVIITTYQAGANFYQGNNIRASGLNTEMDFVRLNPEFEENDFRARAERIVGRALSPSEISSFWFNQGLDFIRNEPKAFLKLFWKKNLLLLNNYEIPDNYDFTFMRERVPVLKFGAVSFGFLLVFGLCGITLNRNRSPGFWLMVFYLVVYTTSIVLFFVSSRYRLPILPALYPFAAWFLTKGWRQLVELNNLHKILFTLGLLTLTWTVFRPFSISDPSFSRWKLGMAFQHAGQSHKAEEQFLKASTLNPGNDKAALQLGIIYQKRGDERRALDQFEKAIRINPKSTEALFRSATIYFLKGYRDKAELRYKKALTLRPNVPQAHFNLAVIYFQQNLLNKSFFELRTALRLKPRYAEAHFNIARIFFLKNKHQLARYHYLKARAFGFSVDEELLRKLDE
tara:strand:+ start:1018 stop:2892 length:1875 start_codon:yes stop_codon:yes gene_type:complete